MRRRDFLVAGLAVAASAGRAAAKLPWDAEDGAAFDADMVRRLARDLAQASYKAPNDPLPAPLKDLGYDAYRAIRFLPEHALWRGAKLPFEVQFFHRGSLFADRVAIYEVSQGRAVQVRYAPNLFSFGDTARPEGDLGFAGFRLHAPINRADYFDEVAIFLGASYFRAVAKGQAFGLSARGLSINTGDPKGEEFPAFRAFWIERPQANAPSIVVHALLDSTSASAAYRFTIRPGQATICDVEAALYPRAAIAQAGLATLTSMFFFDAHDRDAIDDFRPAVHDSSGLAIHTGHGERLWRPLANPRDLQVSSFVENNVRGFGLIQRQRTFAAYDDLEAQYERRPSAWVEPIGDWGEGQVQLIEIPTKNEYNDNIVVFWRPKEPLQAKREYAFTYRVHWTNDDPNAKGSATFVESRQGGAAENRRLFVLDATGESLERLPPETQVRGDVVADKGKILNVVSQPNPHTRGWRLSFQLDPAKATAVELRARLVRDQEPLSETWVYRWTP